MATEAACQVLDSDGSLLEDNLQAALSGILPSYCVVSVFGAQGSGKSTLMNTMVNCT